MAKKVKLTNQADDFSGSAKDERILALGGDDNVSGGGGNDKITGGAGNDVVKGGAGDDKLFGGEGNDSLLGGAGDDTLAGGAGDDIMIGGAGDDTIIAGLGNDSVIGGLGDDVVKIAGMAGAATVEKDGDGFKITTATGVITVSGVELFQFDDKTVTAEDLLGTDIGETLTLTNAVDNIVGTAENDLIRGIVEDDDEGLDGSNTFGPGDNIDGGAGIDTLEITIIDDTSNFGDGFGATASVKNVEILQVIDATTSGADFDLQNFTGLDEIKVKGGDNTTYGFYNLQEAISSVTLDASKYSASDRAMTFYLADINNTVYAGADDTLTVNLNNAGSEEENTSAYMSVYDADGSDVIENYSVVVSGDDNYLYIDNDNGADDAELKSITVTNAAANTGSVFIEVDYDFALTTLDASKSTGGVHFEYSDSVAGTKYAVTGGTGDDNFGIYTGIFTVNAGDGDDRVALNYDNSADDTNDVIDGGAGRDTLAFDADQLGSILTLGAKNFEVVELSGAASANVTLDADDLGADEVTLGVDVTQTLTIEDLINGTLNIHEDQSGVVVVESNSTADTLAVVVDNDGSAVTLADFQVINVETVTFSIADADDDLDITTIDISGTKSLAFSGKANVDINGVTTTQTLNTVDLSGLTGVFDNSAVYLDADADWLIGNLGNNSQIDLDTTAGRNVLTFGTALANLVSIDNFDFGNAITDDVLDLGALGVTGLADLTLADNGTDTTITSTKFGGSIVLEGVLVADLTPSNFDF